MNLFERDIAVDMGTSVQGSGWLNAYLITAVIKISRI